MKLRMAAFMSFPVTRTHAKFSRFNFSVDHNCLHLGISKSASSQFLGDKLDNYAIVSLITEHESSTTEDRELFVCLQILDDALVRRCISLSQVSECPDTVTLYATETFHKHYKILDHEEVYIRPVKAFPLTKVVFGARTIRCYEWSKKRLFSTGLLVSACQQKVLVRANDRFLAPVIPVFSGDETYSLGNYSDLIALECEPVTQGIISVNTSIVITDMSSGIGLANENHLSPGQSSNAQRDDFEDEESARFQLPEPRIMSDFAQGLLELGDHNDIQNQHSDSGTADDMSLSSAATFEINMDTNDHQNTLNLSLRPVLMPTSSAHGDVFGKGHNSACNSFVRDQSELAYKIGVTKDTLDRLHAYNGSWVKISIARHYSEEVNENWDESTLTETEQTAVSSVTKHSELGGIKTSTPRSLPEASSEPPATDLLPQAFNNTEVSTKVGKTLLEKDKKDDRIEKSTMDQLPHPSPEGQRQRAHLAQIYVVNPKLFSNGDKKIKRNGAHVPFSSNEVEFTVQDDSVAISPQLWFNIQAHPSQLIQPDTMVSIKLATEELQEYSCILATSQSITTSCKPPVATAVHLSLIKSPHYPITSQFDDAIKKYFSTTRLLSEGDVISLSTLDFPEFTQEAGEGGGQRLPIIYFLVNKIISPVKGAVSYLANVLHTTVYQEGPKPSFVPVTSDVYLSNRLDPLWASPVPAGIGKYPFQLEQQVLPFLLGRAQCERLPASILLTGPAGCGKTMSVKAVCRQLNLHCVSVNCYDLLADTSAATEAKIRNTFFKAGMSMPCVILLRNIHAIGRDREGSGDDMRVAAYLKETITNLHTKYPDWPMIVIATAPSAKRVTVGMQSSFLHHLEIEAPTEHERCEILQALCERLPLAADVEIPHIAKRTAGMVLRDLAALHVHTIRAALSRIMSACSMGSKLSIQEEKDLSKSGMVLGDLAALHAHTIRAALSRIVSACSVGSKLSIQEEKDICAAGVQFHQSDFEMALSKLQSAHADSIGAPKIPNVSWDDVGGLSDVKAEILDTIQLPLQHPELFAAGLRRSGVLLYGPPGTGKTLLAKAVATECSLNFLSVKGPELINMYVGQSEENVREVFIRARSASPCVIFFDELDSLAPNRGRSGDSGGVMDRVVSQLLAELDGLHKSADVFVIGATNRPDLLDPALLRPGRFDKLLYLGVSEDRSSQSRILHALTRKFNLSTSLELDVIAERCPLTLTGADFYALCSDAMLGAIKRKIASLEAGETTDQTTIVVDERDFQGALDRLVPSISEQELSHYKQIQNRISRGL